MSIKIEPYLRKYNKLKSGECPIYIRVNIDGKNHWINLKERVTEKNWNKKDKYEPIKKTYFRSKALNRKIRLKTEEIYKIVDDLEMKHTKITFDLIKKMLNGYDNSDFIQFCEDELKHNSKKYAYNTLRGHKSRLNFLKEFANNSLPFSSITYEFLEKYKTWLIYEVGNEETAAEMKLRFIREYLKKAERKNIKITYPFNTFKLKFNYKPKRRLTSEEVIKLERILDSNELDNPTYNALHVFMIALYTGFRYGDYKNFNNFRDKNWIELLLDKTKNVTGKVVRLPLHSKAKQLLNGQYTIMTNQSFNKYIKKACEKAGIENPNEITSHTARHTFATRLVDLSNGMIILKDFMGHKDYRSSLVYAKVSDTKKVSVIENFGYVA